MRTVFNIVFLCVLVVIFCILQNRANNDLKELSKSATDYGAAAYKLAVLQYCTMNDKDFQINQIDSLYNEIMKEDKDSKK